MSPDLKTACLTIGQLKAQGYTVTLTPPDPDEPWREALDAFEDAYDAAIQTGLDYENCSIAGLRAAWPHMPETRALQALLDDARSLIAEMNDRSGLDRSWVTRADAFLAKHDAPKHQEDSQ